jgi:hypothetical protein
LEALAPLDLLDRFGIIDVRIDVVLIERIGRWRVRIDHGRLRLGQSFVDDRDALGKLDRVLARLLGQRIRGCNRLVGLLQFALIFSE